ncbi:MAG TPA: hypothetical protein VGI29_03650, partial [Candidatus Binataceae bacterium]
ASSVPSLLLRFGAALALLVLAGCTNALVSGGRVNIQHAEAIYTDVQELRELHFKTDVPLVLMDRGRADFVMQREFESHHDAAELQRAAAVGELTGLYASPANLENQTMRVLSSQVVAFYDPQDREMVLVKGKSETGFWSKIAGVFRRRDSTSEMLIAHELTHALQDQYFGAHTAIDRITDNDDRRLALKSVVEGDATLVGYGCTTGIIDAHTINDLLAHLGDMPRVFDLQSPEAPAALRDPLIFQYTDGTRFVGQIFLHGGWNAVNALYTHPPLSTREILNPALYLARVAPLRITVGGWARVLKGWRKVGQNTYGELLLRVILARGSSGAAALANGWRGDRMAVLQNEIGATTVVWVVAFADDTSAAAFSRAYEGILERNAIGGVPPIHHVERRGTAVLAIVGPGAIWSADLAPAVWRASTIMVAAPPGV